VGEVGPTEEICDELDNDCDSYIDEEGECNNSNLMALPSGDDPDEPTTPDCYDSDGINYFEAGWVAYLDPDKYEGVVIANWPNPSPGRTYQDYCKISPETGELTMVVEYTCGEYMVRSAELDIGGRDDAFRTTSNKNQEENYYKELSQRDMTDLELQGSNNLERIDPNDDGEDDPVRRPRPDSEYYHEHECDYGCYYGRCIRSPVEATITPGSYIWASPETQEGLIRFRCDGMGIGEGIDEMTLEIKAYDQDINEVVSFFDSVDCGGRDYCRIPDNGVQGGGYYSDMIPGFWAAFPGTWSFTCTAIGPEHSDTDTLTISTDNCSISFCPPSRSFALYPIYETNSFMIDYIASARSEELRNLEVMIYKKLEGETEFTPYKIYNQECEHDRCTFYGIYDGEAHYKVTTTIYDQTGMGYTNVQYINLIETG